MDKASIDRRCDAMREAPPNAREHRSSDNVTADTHSQLAIEIRGRETETSRADDTKSTRQYGACRDDVAGTHGLADLRARGHTDGQRVIGAPALTAPRHVELGPSAVAC